MLLREPSWDMMPALRNAFTKSSTRHVAIDPDAELITATAVSPGNVGDAAPAEVLLADLLEDDEQAEAQSEATTSEHPIAYGDNAYGTGELHTLLGQAGVEDRLKTQDPVAPAGRFAKDRFQIDLEADTVTCPSGLTVAVRRRRDGSGTAAFKDACASCPLREQCTASRTGRVVNVNRNEAALAAARERQRDPAWRKDYRATRPKVERKLAHLMRRQHGGRRARVRGLVRVGADFALLAAAHNLARLALLGLRSTPTGWSVA